MTHNGQNKQNIKTKTVAFDLGRVETPTLAGRVEPFCSKFRVTKTDNASEDLRLDAMFENYIFYIFRMYEFSHGQNSRATCAVEGRDDLGTSRTIECFAK